MDTRVASPPPGTVPARPRRDFSARLFGYDVFISFALGPAPRGCLSYASDLARRLRERDFTVFFSEDEAPPGEQLDETLRKALHRSRALVVIANRGTLQEPRWVRVEVESFRGLTPARPVIPISVGGALQDPQLAASTKPWLPFEDRIWLDEKQEAVDSGIASPDLVERLALAPRRMRSNLKWRWLVGIVTGALALLAVGLAVVAKLARDAEARAVAELERAVSLRAAAEAPAMVAGTRAGGHERALQQLLGAHTLGTAPVEVSSAMLSVLLELPRALKMLDSGAPVNAAAFSPQPGADRFVSGGAGGRVQRWDATTLRPVGEPLKGPSVEVLAVAYSPDGRHIAAGDLKGRLWLWQADTGDPLPVPQSDETRGAVRSIAFTPDGRHILSGGVGGALQRWDAATGAPVGDPVPGFGEVVAAVAVSPDGRRIVSGGDAYLQLWMAADMESVGLEGHELGATVLAVAFSPDGARMASGSNDGTVRLWDVRKGSPVGAPLRARGAVNSVAFSPDGARLLVGAAGGSLVLWDVRKGEPVAEWLKNQDGAVKAIAFGADGRLAVTAGDDGMLRVWDASGAVAIGEARTDEPPAPATPDCAVPPALQSMRVVGWSADCAVAALGTRSALRLADVRSGEPLGDAVVGHRTREVRDANAKEPRINILSAAFSQDGRWIVSGSQNRTLQRWERDPLRPLGAPLDGHASDVVSVAISPDGHTIASGDRDGAVRLWDLTSGQPIGPPLSHPGGVRALAFSADGAQLVSRGEDETWRAWPAPSTWPDLLCAKLTRDMSPAQWREWLSPELAFRAQCPLPEGVR